MRILGLTGISTALSSRNMLTNLFLRERNTSLRQEHNRSEIGLSPPAVRSSINGSEILTSSLKRSSTRKRLSLASLPACPWMTSTAALRHADLRNLMSSSKR